MIEKFTLVHQNQTQLPTSWRAASEKHTLFVRSTSLISVRSKISDANSGLDAVNVSVRVAANSEPEKLVYGGLARHVW